MLCPGTVYTQLYDSMLDMDLRYAHTFKIACKYRSLIFVLVGVQSDRRSERFRVNQKPTNVVYCLMLVIISCSRETPVLRGVVSKFIRVFEGVPVIYLLANPTGVQRSAQRFRPQRSS